MFCKYCGNELKENARFCTKCGRENISKVNVVNEFDKEIIPNISTDIVEKSMIEDKTEMFDGVEETQNQMDSRTEEDMHTTETPVAKTSKNGNNKAVKVILIIIMLLVVASGGAFAGLKYLEYKEEKRLIEEQKSYEEYIKSVEKLLQKNKVLFEKVNSILVWILLFPYTTSLTMDFTDSMIKIYIGLDSSG